MSVWDSKSDPSNHQLPSIGKSHDANPGLILPLGVVDICYQKFREATNICHCLKALVLVVKN